MKLIKSFIITICCFVSSHLIAQSAKTIKADLLKSYDKIHYWELEKYNHRTNKDSVTLANDSLELVNKLFQKKLELSLGKFPYTFQMSFSSFFLFGTAISVDKQMRIYSWNTYYNRGAGDEIGLNFASVIQYRNDNNMIAVSLKDWLQKDSHGMEYFAIYPLKTKNETYYIVEQRTALSPLIEKGAIAAWSIDNGILNQDVKLFKTKSGFHNSISFEFKEWDTDINKFVRYSKKTRTIFIPVVNDKGKVTNQSITYKFTGKYFEKVKP